MYGWGVNESGFASQEAANIRYPMESVHRIWWSGSENDVRPAGRQNQPDGYKALDLATMCGDDFRLRRHPEVLLFEWQVKRQAGRPDRDQAFVITRGLYASDALAD